MVANIIKSFLSKSAGFVNRFVANIDGTVCDSDSGKTWMRCAMGQKWDGFTCIGTASRYTWNEAMACKHEFAGHNDWRMPNIDELQSLSVPSEGKLNAYLLTFPKAPTSDYWSSTISNNNQKNAQYLMLPIGKIRDSHQDCSRNLRLVRDTRPVSKDGVLKLDLEKPLEIAKMAVNSVSPVKSRVITADSSGRPAQQEVTLSSEQDNNELVHLLIQIEKTDNRWPSRELINYATSHPERINDKAKTSALPAHTLLHAAVFFGKQQTIEWLTRKGADINALDENNKTPLDYADKTNIDLANYLRRHGAIFGTNRTVDSSERAEKNKESSLSVTVPIITYNGSGYIDNNDGTVTNIRTGLTWMRCALEQTWDGSVCVGDANTHSWHAAITTHYSYAGHADWRLPNLDELQDIVDSTTGSPATNTDLFPNTPSTFFWTSTTRSDNAIGIDFGHGLHGVGSKDGKGYVRLVRGGPSGSNTSQPTLVTQPTGKLKSAEKDASLSLQPNKGATNSVDAEPLITKIANRLDQIENRFESTLNRIESMLESLIASQAKTLDILGQLQQQSSISADKLGGELTKQRQQIRGLETIFKTSVDSIELALKSLSNGQYNSMGLLTELRQTLAVTNDNYINDIAQLRRELTTVPNASDSQFPDVPSSTVSTKPVLSSRDSLTEFFAWLVGQEFANVSDLRTRLLPLYLLPNAVIDDINERAINLTGEIALEEQGDSIVVHQDVLLQVIASTNHLRQQA